MFILKRVVFIIMTLATSMLFAKGLEGEYSVYNSGNRYIEKYDDNYMDNIQSILSQRCSGCHSCTSGPCQLNLTSYEGLIRGMSKENPHDLNRRFKSILPARLTDRRTVADWRSRGFHPVVAQGKSSAENESSILFLALEHGENFDLTFEEMRQEGLRQESEVHQCPVNKSEYETYKEKFPLGGMPSACPGLSNSEVQALKNWVLAGAKGPSKATQDTLSKPEFTSHTTDKSFKIFHDLEAFLNQDSMKQQVISRYIFEHAYSLHLHFNENPGEFYRIVRSKTAAPLPIEILVTEFATEKPNYNGRIYYRLEKLKRAIEMKRHPVWKFSSEDLKFLKTNFTKLNWNVNRMPQYTENPFEWFKVIPVQARAEYVVKYAKNIWHSVARGSICHSREASYIEPDYSWYLMLKPSSDPTVLQPKLGFKDYDNFYAHPSEGVPRMKTLSYNDEPKAYQKAFNKALLDINPNGLGIEDIEDDFFYGLRHETSFEFFKASESVIPGYPKYKRLLSYADTERYYYRTVVHFRHYGSALEKSEAFAFAGHIRGFSENLFASLHPKQSERRKQLNFNTDLVGRTFYALDYRPDLKRPTKTPKNWSYEDISQKIVSRLNNVNEAQPSDLLNNWPKKNLPKGIKNQIADLQDWEAALRTLTGFQSTFVRYLPNNIHIRVEGQHLYTIFVDRGYTNDRIPGKQGLARRPKLDRALAVKGFTGSFPHMYIDLSFSEAANFIKLISSINHEGDWVNIVNKYGIRKDDARFWKFTDWLHGWISANLKAEAGILDLRNYDLRDKPF